MHEMSLFEKILHTNIINFIIVVSTLVWIFKKANLGALIQKLADDVRLSVEKSSNNAQSAISQYKSTKKSTKDTPKLQEEIISQAKSNAQSIKEKIEQKTLLEKYELKKSITKMLSSQKEKYKKLTIDEVYTASINIAKEEVQKRLDETTHQKLIQKSIEELDKIEGSLSWIKI